MVSRLQCSSALMLPEADRGEREEIGGVWGSDERGVGGDVGRAQRVYAGYME